MLKESFNRDRCLEIGDMMWDEPRALLIELRLSIGPGQRNISKG